MAVNRVFFPQEALDLWLADNAVELTGDIIVMGDKKQRYRISEGARVLQELTGAGDPYEIVGRCKSLIFLKELGADVVENSMIIDDYAYDIVTGFLGIPVTSKQETSDTTRPAQLSDEDLLAEFLAHTM